MTAPPEPTCDDDAVLEEIAGRIARLNRLAALLDSLGQYGEAAEALARANDFAHLLDLLRSGGATPPGPPPVTH